jgi:DNA-binding NtrC family response regulator
MRDGVSFLIKKGAKDHKSLDDMKAEYITEILKETGGNKRLASEILKVNPRTLYRFEKKTRIDDETEIE